MAVRSEQPSLRSLGALMAEVTKTANTEELAHMLLLINEVYADSACRCEEKGVAYGEDSEEVIACDRNVGRTQRELLDIYRTLIERLKGGAVG